MNLCIRKTAETRPPSGYLKNYDGRLVQKWFDDGGSRAATFTPVAALRPSSEGLSASFMNHQQFQRAFLVLGERSYSGQLPAMGAILVDADGGPLLGCRA
jgi:hypothetical protein